MVITGGLVIEFFDAGDFTAAFVSLGVIGFLDDGDAGPLGESLDGIDEGEVLIVHEEAQGIPALATAEAFIVLLGGIDVKGGGLFVMEGTVTLKGGAGAFQREVGSDEIDDVGGIQDLFHCFFWNAAHGGSLRHLWRMENWIFFAPLTF